jgi:drug/metabolite transporter (DMT)-like permease
VRNRPLSSGGLALAVLSGATFGTSGSFASSLIGAGWTPGAAVTARVTLAGALLTVPALLQLRRHRVSKRATRTVLLYGVVAVAGAQLCYFNAVAHLSVAVALLLEYSGILLVVGWGWARHGHRPRRLTTIGGAASLGGLILVLDLAGAHQVDLAGVLWGFGAAVGLAVYFVIASATDDALPPLSVAWGGLAVGAVLLGIAAATGVLPVHAPRNDVTLLDKQVSWIVPVLGLSVVAGVVAYLSGIAAARMLGAKLASFVGLTEVLAAVVFAWLLVGQRLNAVQLAGGVLVVSGIALVRSDEMRGQGWTGVAGRPTHRGRFLVTPSELPP